MLQRKRFTRSRLQVERLEHRLALATVNLVKDINQEVLAESAVGIIPSGSNIYYRMSTPTMGDELYITDGTLQGTSLLKDINPGMADSDALNFVTIGNDTFFSATDDGGIELWKTSGTTQSTVKVKEINPNGSAEVSDLTVMAGVVYFAADDGVNGKELWKSDGTAAGTVMVRDINPGAGDGSPNEFAVVNGLLFMSARVANQGFELWRSDGTSVGTTLVRDIRPGSSSSYMRYLTNVSGTLFFRAEDGTSGAELWKSNGTFAGTVLVEDINPGADSSTPGTLTNVNGSLLFTATNANGRELWRSDGTNATTFMVKDISSGGYSGPSDLVNVGGTLYFSARDAAGTELWKSNGTSASTVRVKDIVPGSGSSSPTSMTNVNGIIYFSATDAVEGRSLWKSDGTAVGTVMLMPFEVDPLFDTYSLRNFVNANGTLYFTVNPDFGEKYLWKSNGTTTERAFQWDKTGDSNPQIVMTKNEKVYFFASQFGTASTLWVSDGTSNGTMPVVGGQDFLFSNITRSLVIDGLLYFVASTTNSGNELWRSDGTPEGTYLLKDIVPGADSSQPLHLTNVNGTLYFSVTSGPGSKLWKSNGTISSTVPVVSNAFPLTGASNLVNFNGTLYFMGQAAGTGSELWKSTGTESGTVLVRDIWPGATSSNPSNLQVMGSQLYFFASDSIHQQELWRSDGTALGTVRISDVNTATTLVNLAHGDNRLYFYDSADNFWSSDGALSTTLLKGFADSSLSDPGLISVLGDTAYFIGKTVETGIELWKSDGTVAGTTLVKDIYPGPGSGGPSSLTYLNGLFYFSANNGISGQELWTSDGTAAGTQARAFIASASGGSQPSNFTLVGSKLFMVATSDQYSRELFVQSTELRVDLAGVGPRSTTIRKNGGQVEIVNDATGAVLDSLELEYLQSITLNGISGVDTVTIDYAYGGFFPLPGGMAISGASGADTVNIIGLTNLTAQYLASGNGPGNATINLQLAGTSHSLSLTNFEALSITGMLSVASQGTLLINGQSMTVGSVAPFNLGNITQLTSANLNSSSTIALGSGEALMGSGNVLGRFSGETGSLLVSQGGSLIIGSNSSSAGFFTNGEIQVVSSLLIQDANQAVLGELTTLGTAVAPASLLASNGLIIDFGRNVVGYGTLNTTNSLSKQLINNGSISGNSAAQLITLTGYVKGVGALNNVNLAGTYSPGLSPALVQVGSVTYSPSSTTVIELGGLVVGSQYDQIQHTGQANLGGVLDVDLIDGFVPNIGDVFTILTASNTVVGAFGTVSLPSLPSDRQWKINYSANAVALAVEQANQAPTDIGLSANQIIENSPTNTVVGTFNSIDPNSNNTFTYSLVSGAGSSGNGQFQIDNSGQLKTLSPLDFEASSSYSIRVRSTDQGGLWVEKAFTISLVDLPELVGLPQFGDGSAQRSSVQQIVITFDGAVDILDGAFTLVKRGPGGGTVDTSATAVVLGSGQTMVTLSFSGSFTRASGALVDGYYELTIQGGRILRAGNRLDANQDGIGGDVVVRGALETDNFFALYGDTNGDGVLGIAEFGQFRTAFGKLQGDPSYNRLFDYEGDGAISVSDFGQFRSRFGKPKIPFV